MTPREICLQLAMDIEKSSTANPFGSIDLWPYFERALHAERIRLATLVELPIPGIKKATERNGDVLGIQRATVNALQAAAEAIRKSV